MTIAKICPAPKCMQPCSEVYVARETESGRDEYLHTDGRWHPSTKSKTESSTGYFPNEDAAEKALQESLEPTDSDSRNIHAEAIEARRQKAVR